MKKIFCLTCLVIAMGCSSDVEEDYVIPVLDEGELELSNEENGSIPSIVGPKELPNIKN